MVREPRQLLQGRSLLLQGALLVVTHLAQALHQLLTTAVDGVCQPKQHNREEILRRR